MTQIPSETLMLLALQDVAQAVSLMSQSVARKQTHEAIYRNQITLALEAALAHAQGRLVSPCIGETDAKSEKEAEPAA